MSTTECHKFLFVRDLLETTARHVFPLRAILETGGGVQELVRGNAQL
jgi:hypothetical protein